MQNEDETRAVPFPVQEWTILSSESTTYRVLEFMGEGTFGKVAKCVDMKTKKLTAIKILKDSNDPSIKKEVEMLKMIRDLGHEKNVVQFIEEFMYQGLLCIAFEMLDMSLCDLMVGRKQLTIQELRPITQQLLVAFEALRGIGVLHTDLKPDNIMLVNQQEQPFKVKLIDFGLARLSSEATDGEMLQPTGYRAPEVALGLPISEAIDIWGLGCVLASLFIGCHLFPVDCEYDMMRAICLFLGQPEDHILYDGQHTWMYFTQNSDGSWRLNTPREYEEAVGIEVQESTWPLNGFRSLDGAVLSTGSVQEDVELLDRMEFLDLLKRLLAVDPDMRITSSQALQHHFVTMAHLEEYKDSDYADSAFKLMSVCNSDPLPVAVSPSSEPEADTKSSDEDWYSPTSSIEAETTVSKAGFCNLQRARTYTVEYGTLLRPIVQCNNNVCLNIVGVTYEDRTSANPNTSGHSDTRSLNYGDDVCTADSDDHPSTDFRASTEKLLGLITSLELQISPVITTCTDAASLVIQSVSSLDFASEASARPGSADGAAATDYSNNSATEANAPDHLDVADTDPDGVKKKRKPFRRVRKFASRLRKGVVSIFKKDTKDTDTDL